MNTLLTFFLSFSTGLLAALNPCTTPIYPLIFSYYLKKNNKTNLKKTLMFISGFLLAFIILASIIIYLGTFNNIQESIRFIAAGITALLGIMFLLKGVHFEKLQNIINKIESPFLFGAIFGLALNPCSLPLFLANTTISLGVGSFANIIAFGLGIATPPILIALFGSELIKKISLKVTWAYDYLDKIVGTFLLLAAVFLILLVSASPIVSVISSIFILSFFIFLIFPFWKKIFFARKHRIELIVMTIFLFLLWLVMTYRCYLVSFSTHYSCGVTCTPCQTCLALLIGVLILGFIGFHYLEKIHK